MSTLSERLEIRVRPEQMESLKKTAQIHGISVAEFVREAIQQKLEEDRKERLRSASQIGEVNAPVSDWETMESEIHPPENE